jgi:DNA-directed RNA polymerase specialized sigma24 family protein
VEGGGVDDDYSSFFADAEPRLRRAFVAHYGSDRGREAAAEALAYAWEHWPRIAAMERPLAYLFRVGQSRTRRWKLRTDVAFPEPDPVELPWVEPALPRALNTLSPRQRTAVVLVCGFGWPLREVGELLGLKTTTVQNHVERGLAKLRLDLEVLDD